LPLGPNRFKLFEWLRTTVGHKLDVLLGAGTMEQWEISVNPKERSLGLEGLKRREFAEY